MTVPLTYSTPPWGPLCVRCCVALRSAGVRRSPPRWYLPRCVAERRGPVESRLRWLGTEMASAFELCRPTSGWPSSSALCCTQRGAAVRRSPMLMSSRSARRVMPPWWCPPTQTTSLRSRPAYPAYGSSSDGRPISERCADPDTGRAGEPKAAPASTARLHPTTSPGTAALQEGRFPRTFDEPQRDRPNSFAGSTNRREAVVAVGDAPSLAVPAAGRYRVDPQ